jgi:hypothetical protein
MLLSVLAAAATAGQDSAKRGLGTIYEKSMPGALDRCVVVNDADFGLGPLRSLSESFLARHPGLAVSRLLMGTRREDIGLVRSGKGVSDTDFGEWMRAFDERRQKHFPVAELIQIGPSAVLRVRWPDGRQERIVLRGNDILEQRVGDLNIQLKWMYFSYAPLLKKTSLYVFLQAERLISEGEARAVAAHFRERVKVSPVSFKVRSDPWFIDDDFYPFVNPFYPAPPRPSREDYLGCASFFCSSDDGPLSCIKFDGPLHVGWPR